MTETTSTGLGALATALAKAQGAVKAAVKDSVNPHYKSRYADLASIWDACREPLSKNGLSVVQMPGEYKDGNVSLETVLLHTSGECLRAVASAPCQQQTAQGVGSALTYLRRYALAAFVGIAPEEDDGEAASEQPYRPPAPDKDGVIHLPTVIPFGEDKGKKLKDCPDDYLAKVRKWCQDKKRSPDLVEAIDIELDSRREPGAAS